MRDEQHRDAPPPPPGWRREPGWTSDRRVHVVFVVVLLGILTGFGLLLFLIATDV